MSASPARPFLGSSSVAAPYGTRLLALRIDHANFDDFVKLIQPCQDNAGCDTFAAPGDGAVEAFLQAHGAKAVPMLPASRPLLDLSGRTIGERRWLHHSGTTLDPEPVPPRGPQGQVLLPRAEQRRAAYEAALQDLIAADHDESGSVYMRLAELTDPEGDQLALFHRAEGGAWSVVHLYARSEADYLADLLQHPPVEGYDLLRADRWKDGTLTLTRLFVLDGQPFALPLYEIGSRGRVVPGYIPEDRHVDKAVPLADWFAERRTHHGGHAQALDPRSLDWATLLDGQASRFTIVKYSATPDAVLGQYAPPGEVTALLQDDGWEMHESSGELMSLIPVTRANWDAVAQLTAPGWSQPPAAVLDQASLRRFAEDSPVLAMLQGEKTGTALWAAAPFTVAPKQVPQLDAVPPQVASGLLRQSVETVRDADGRLGLHLAAGALPWEGLLAVYRPNPGAPLSAALLLNTPEGLPACRLFGPDIAGATLHPAGNFVAHALARMQPPAAPRRMAPRVA